MNECAVDTENARLKRVVLAGNPNCGKTTLFNVLTGLRHKVANYPGVTVERKIGHADLDGVRIEISDLPGLYSICGHSLDEEIASRALLGIGSAESDKPDLIVVVIDATNLERNLLLATQALELGIPALIALNMSDLAEKRGIRIRGELLGRLLGAQVVAISASSRSGIDELKRAIRSQLLHSTAAGSAQWLPQEHAYRKAAEQLGMAAAGRTLASPGDLLRGSILLSGALTAADVSISQRTAALRAQLSSQQIDCTSFEATERYRWINSVVRQVVVLEGGKPRLSERVDRVLSHPVAGSLVFALIMFSLFQGIFTFASVPMEAIDQFFAELSQAARGFLGENRVSSLVSDGIIPGVGSVLVFIPQIAILFLFIGILEDTGYLSRAAFLMDRVMRRVGLQGRSFIPLLSSFACAIPGILATRTISSFADRMCTILIAPLMSCSARLPVYTLLIAACIPEHRLGGIISLQGLVLFGLYLLGILGAALMALLLKRLMFRGAPTLFVMEMPPFRRPALVSILRDVVDRVLIFIKSAGTVILACSVILWFLASTPAGSVENSYAGRLGRAIEPVIEPLGLDWRMGIGILASFAAREVFVSAMATVYHLENEDDSAQSLIATLREKTEIGEFSLASALSLLVFYVFACQCISTLAVTRRETGSWRWPAFMFAYMTVLAWVAAFCTYRVVSLW